MLKVLIFCIKKIFLVENNYCCSIFDYLENDKSSKTMDYYEKSKEKDNPTL